MTKTYVFLFFLCTSRLLSAQAPLPNWHETVAQFPEETVLALAWIEGDTITYEGLHRTSTGIQSTDLTHARFGIGSLTKLFTSFRLAQAATEDSTVLAQSAASCFPYPLHGAPDFTLEELATHRSGLPRVPHNWMAVMTDIQNPYINYTDTVFAQYLQQELQIDTATRGTLAYSNLGYAILGQALAHRYQMPLYEQFEQYIFEPLGLLETTANLNDIPENQRVLGRNQSGEITAPWDFAAFAGAGGVFSSTYDLARFCQAQWTQPTPALLLQQQVHFTKSEIESIALGWIVLQQNGRTIHMHNGGTSGYTSVVIVDLEAQRAAVCLTNISAFHPQSVRLDYMVFKEFLARSKP